MNRSTLKVFLVVLLISTTCLAQKYTVKRIPDGTVQSKVLNTIVVNEGTSLPRESILFNDPSCPVVVDGNSMSIGYSDRNYLYQAATTLNVKQPIMALSLRHIIFDAFGQHVVNLSNVEIKDIPSGTKSLKASWRMYNERDTAFLTSVTYVDRVRLEDGTQWISNKDNLILALAELKLEKKIESDPKK